MLYITVRNLGCTFLSIKIDIQINRKRYLLQ
uniref:Uncharacterized protein n=1 Tax=Arundo donax TaxID=35708 RepID=A0A0A8ZFJ8_ARUDO